MALVPVAPGVPQRPASNGQRRRSSSAGALLVLSGTATPVNHRGRSVGFLAPLDSPLAHGSLTLTPTSHLSSPSSPSRKLRRRWSTLPGDGGVPNRLASALQEKTAWPDFEKVKELRRLALTGMKFGEREMAALPQVLRETPFLQELDLSHNRVGAHWMSALVAGAKSTRDLHTLRFYGCDLVDLAGLAECAATVYIINNSGVPQTTGLKHLMLGSNRLGGKGLAALATASKHAPNLETIELDRNPLGEAGAISLAQGIFHARKLRKLGVGECRIGDRGAIALARGLSRTAELRELRLECNDIGLEGVVELGHAFRITTALVSLDISWNRLRQEGVNVLAEGVARCRNMERLTLNGNGLDPAAERELSRGLLQIASGGLQPAMGRA